MIYFYIFLFIGIFYFFGNIFVSSWDVISGGLLDARLANYILEHNYLYVVNLITHTHPVHSELLSLPIFYPIKNTIALSDTYFSLFPIYSFFRLIFDYSISYSMTAITIAVLNYTSFYFILKKLNFTKMLSAFGAFLFAFSYINKITYFHIQMETIFFSLFAMLALLNVSKDNSKNKNFILFITAGTLMAMQFYASYYLAFFFYLLVLFSLVICLCNKDLKQEMKYFIKEYKKEIIYFVLWAIVLSLPMIRVYLGTGIKRSYDDVILEIPYFHQLFTGGTYFIKTFASGLYEFVSVEFMLMFTYGLLLFGLIGLAKIKKYNVLIISLFLVSALFIIKFKFLNNFSLWDFIYSFVPGSIGIREPIRLILVLNAFLVLGFINFLANSKWNKIVLLIIAAFVVFEQLDSYDWNKRLFSDEVRVQQELEMMNLPSDCKYLDVVFDLDDKDKENVYAFIQKDINRISIMWFASTHNMYFMSGYSGLTEEATNIIEYNRSIFAKEPGYCLIKKKIRLPR